ncbi:MAG TPA: hypothetical protein VFF68_03945, partial [Anaerolineaceae bacterium]|nr:hypothetical protein [Anaerolineaceae bacterium]
FAYSAVFTASREAARYGAAVGIGPNGRPYFQDCTGMRTQAKKIGSLAGLQDADIIIAYDNPDTAKSGLTCNDQVSPNLPLNDEIELGDRVIVTVHITYAPLIDFLGLPDFNIESTARRTIVRGVQFVSTTPMPSKTIDPTEAFGLTQTSAAITATAAAATPEPVCPPGGTFSVPVATSNKKVVQFTVANPTGNTDALMIESMSLNWEDSKNKNVQLSDIQFGSTTVWSTSTDAGPLAISSWPGPASAREIAAGASKTLTFFYDNNLELINSANWWVTIQFSGACEETVTWTGSE